MPFIDRNLANTVRQVAPPLINHHVTNIDLFSNHCRIRKLVLDRPMIIEFWHEGLIHQ